MRVSTGQIYATGLGALLEQQSRLTKTQEQVTTGKRILSPSDDPIGSVRAIDLSRAIERVDQFKLSGNTLDSRLRLEENVLSNSVDLLQRVRELAIQGANASQSNESRAAIAKEVWQHMDALVNYANTRDSSGNYIFAGFKQGSQPFSYVNSLVTYNGDDGVRELQVGPSGTIADGDPGSAVFMHIPSGNGRFEVAAKVGNQGTLVADSGAVFDPAAFTGESLQIEFVDPGQYRVLDSLGNVLDSGAYRTGESISVAGVTVGFSGLPASGDVFTVSPSTSKDVFSMVAELAQALGAHRSSASDRANFSTVINNVISNLDQALDHFVDKQAAVGSRMNSLEVQMDINSGAEIRLQEALAGVTELDYAEGITRMNQQLLGLQAAQQAFAKVQNLSLFNYL